MLKKIITGLSVFIALVLVMKTHLGNSDHAVQSDPLEQKWYRMRDSAISNIISQRFSRAIVYLDTCIGITPHADFLYNVRGCCYVNKASVNDSLNNTIAVLNFSKAIEINNKAAKYYNNRGWSYQMLEDYTKARIDFEKAVELAPDSMDFQNNVLRIRYINKENKLALQICDTLINKFPNCGYAYYVRGKLKRDYLHKYPEGNVDIKKGEALDWNGGMNMLY